MSAPDLARPLDPVSSIKTRLGLLVAVSVLVSALLVTLGSLADVPWLLTVPVAVGLALAVTQLLAGGMTAPLREMTAAAQRMARGDYAVRVPTRSADEVGRLAHAFNAMAEDLAAVDAQRRALVADVAHELRTPIAGVAATLENMADGVVEPDPERLRGVLDQVERLGVLVRDLLDLSRADAGVAPFSPVRIDVHALVAEVLDEARSRRPAVRLDLAGVPGLRAAADPDRLRQLVTNLVDNAVRHSPEGGLVSLVVEPVAADRWVLEVRDQGPGIAPADRERIFERFGRTDPTTGGTGLGLAICRWVADLHGGRIQVLDPLGAGHGARVRVELPVEPAPHSVPTSTSPSPTPGVAMSTLQPPAPSVGAPPPPAGPAPGVLAPWWPESLPARRDLLAAAGGVGTLAGALLLDREPGLALSLILLACGGVVCWAMAGRRDRFATACAGLAALLALVPMLRDAGWLQALSILTATLLMVVGVTGGRRVADFALAAIAWPASAVRGLPWLGRTIGALRAGSDSVRVVRTVIASLLVLLVFGVLLASGDALMGRWLGALVPDVQGGDWVFRVFIALAVFGALLSAVFLTLAPVPLTEGGGARTLGRRYEWLAPVLIVDALFALFLVAQATAYFGGEAYLRRTTGLTYSEYVHQGLGQLTVATALTLVVIRLVAPRAARTTSADRLWLRGSLGALCVMTLAVVVSALWRMDLYQQAYGFTVPRVLVDLFQVWLGLLVVMVMLAGVRLSGGWLARAGLLSGAVLMVGLAAINPDAWIAERNIERAEAGRELDVYYLATLSDDATPTLVERLGDQAACAVSRPEGEEDDLGEWNLGRVRAQEARAQVPTLAEAGIASCDAPLVR
ncbi:hypothetical protein GCM10027425_13520 [Alteromonas gracilis]